MNRIVDTIDMFRKIIDERDQHEHGNNSPVEDLKKPGQEFGDGDIRFAYATSDGEGSEEPELTSIPLADGHCFQSAMIQQGNILLDMFNTNGIYLCEKSEMNEKVSQHMTQTGAYLFIEKLHSANRSCVGQHLNQIVKQVTSLLDDLHARQCLNDIQVQQMAIVETSKVQMDYLFFLPDPHQDGVPFQPVMICCLGPTMNIARFIHRLVQPIFDHAAHSTTFFKGSDAVHCIEVYQKKHLLQSNTLFVNLHINDLCTIIPHEQFLEALERFLNEFVLDRQIQCVSIDVLLELVRCVLKNQYFVFDRQIYRQIKGCGSGSPLNQLLANIYLFYWQEDLVKTLVNKKEIFGRCLDEVFLTWNGSKRALETSIQQTIQGKFSFLSLTTKIGMKVNYLDVQISHINGQLQTGINHDRDTMPRTLPFLSDHPFQMYSTLIQACLIRTVLVCLKVSDFQTERQDIEQTFLQNGFTMQFIRAHVEEFFEQFQMLDWKTHLDSNNYEILRQRVLDYDHQHTETMIRERKEEQMQHKWHILSVLNGEDLIHLQRDIKRLWQCSVDKESQLNDVKIEIIHQSKYPANTK